jgi:hypothetical protein
VLFQQCLVDVFGFLKKLFFSNNRWSPPTRPNPSHFPLRFFTLSTPPRPVLRISHSGSLTCRAPPADPSHFSLRFFNPLIPPPDPSHFSLRFFNPSIPSPDPSHFPLQFFHLSFLVLENPTGTKEPSVPFISTTLLS